MNHGLTDEELATIRAYLAQEPGIREAVLFGSRAIGSFKEASDIDIALKGEGLDIFTCGSLKSRLEEETTIPYFFDFVAYDRLSNDELRKHIDTKGMVIYEATDDKWPEVLLEAVADEITVGYVGPMASEYIESGIPFLRSMNVEPLQINKTGLKYITPEFHQKIRKSRLSPGDVVIVRTGKPGACSVIPDWLTDANCSDLVIVRCGNQLSSQFLAYYVNTVATGHVAAHLVGAVQQHFNVGAARELCIKLPSKPEQDAIVAVLASLDDKIDLLRRQNRTLEAMAETLFRQWFVEEMGEDWVEVPVSDYVVLNGSSIGKNYPYDIIQYLDTGSLTEGMMESLQEMKRQEAPSRANRLVKHNDVLISTVRPEQKHYGIIMNPPENMVVSTGFCVLTCAKIDPHFIYLLMTSDEMTEYLHAIAEGSTSTYPSLKPSDIGAITFWKPPPEKLDAFSRMASDIWTRIETIHTQIRTLSSLRDTLLPKLMSGEVRVAA